MRELDESRHLNVGRVIYDSGTGMFYDGDCLTQIDNRYNIPLAKFNLQACEINEETLTSPNGETWEKHKRLLLQENAGSEVLSTLTRIELMSNITELMCKFMHMHSIQGCKILPSAIPNKDKLQNKLFDVDQVSFKLNKFKKLSYNINVPDENIMVDVITPHMDGVKSVFKSITNDIDKLIVNCLSSKSKEDAYNYQKQNIIINDGPMVSETCRNVLRAQNETVIKKWILLTTDKNLIKTQPTKTPGVQ